MAVQKTFEDVRQRLESYASCLVRDMEDAKDIVSSAFTHVLQRPLSPENGVLLPYLFRTVHNLSLNYQRDTARRQAAQKRLHEREGKAFRYYSTMLESCDPSSLFVSEISEISNGILTSLSTEIQMTYLLRCEGRPYKEIAGILGISENWVDKNLRKAISALKKSLSDYL